MNSKQNDEARYYFDEFPSEWEHPAENPYFLKLEDKIPEHVWNEHLPSEFIIEQMERVYRCVGGDSQVPKRNHNLDLIPSGREYHLTWKFT